MRSILIVALLAVSSLFSVNANVTVTAADRAIRGWKASSISANRYNQTAVIADEHNWLTIIHDNPPHHGPPNAPAPPAPFTGLNEFNVTEGHFIYDVAALDNHQAWISVLSFSGFMSHSYIALVDLTNNNVLANISTTKFRPTTTSQQPPFLSADPTNILYAVDGNSIWVFDPKGNQINYFTLQEAAAPIVSLDVSDDGSLWILEDYNSTTQQNRLVHYDAGGQPFQAFNLNFTGVSQTNYLIDLVVSNSEAYITAMGLPIVLCLDLQKGVQCRSIRIDGGHKERQVESWFAPQLTLFNDTILIVVEDSLDAAEAYDLNRRYHSFDIFSREAVLQGASGLRATRAALLVTLDYEQHADVVMIDQHEGALIAEFERPAGRSPFQSTFTAGVTVDMRDTVFVSKETYDFEKHEFFGFVDIYEARRHHMTINVSSSGPIAFDERSQTIWIADDSKKQPIVTAYSPKDGTIIKSFTFNGFDSEHYITDMLILPINITGYLNITVFIASDFASQQIVAETESGEVTGTIKTPGIHPRSFTIDWFTGETFVAVEDHRNETAGIETFIAVYDRKGDFVEQLVAPLGWPRADFVSVAVDFEGTVFATSARYGAVLEWRRAGHGTGQAAEVSWVMNQVEGSGNEQIESYQPRAVTASE